MIHCSFAHHDQHTPVLRQNFQGLQKLEGRRAAITFSKSFKQHPLKDAGMFYLPSFHLNHWTWNPSKLENWKKTFSVGWLVTLETHMEPQNKLDILDNKFHFNYGDFWATKKTLLLSIILVVD